MPKKLPKGVSVDRDRHGNVRLYFRAAGRPKVRLHEMPGSNEFDNEVACARLGVPYVKPGETKTKPVGQTAAQGTFLWLVQQYKARAKIDAGVMARRARLLEEIAKSKTPSGKLRGGALYAQMERRHVLEIRDTLRDKPGAQNDVVKTISALFGWAIDSGLASLNPAARIKRLHSGDGFHTWTVEEVRQYEAKHPAGSKARLALHLGLFTGLRLSDLAIVGKQHVKDGWLTIRPKKTATKTGVVIELPILPPLQKTIDASPTGDLTFLVSEWSRPFTVNSLGNKMRDWCNAADLTHCSMHGLRKAGATIAAENGATDEDLMAIFGWVTKAQTTHYTKKARRKLIAARAAHKLLIEPEQKMDETVPPVAAVEKSGAKMPKKRSKIKG
jgi:integrase